ncbi:hypothetical protein C9374_009108 [Naegleria lovaniensis]|uniref:FERM domain-containing protein n=1 Tax=Naegleria lovaniensis TaxID=51637 RepID=A0AA88KEL0_NAELO|nr:uncharacterized protein C9374_009108 [Naegleria lovaniensis]KAG2377592.1 hypothetical protein C9374_009108 [Naegleria lovaniensis]
MPPLDFIRKAVAKNNNTSSSSGDSSSSPSSNRSSPTTAPSIKIKHKSTLTVQLKYEKQYTSLQQQQSISQHSTQLICFPSDTLQNFVHEKVLPLLGFDVASHLSSSSHSDPLAAFKEKYATFVVRGDMNNSNNSCSRGDWIFNYGLTFNDLKLKGSCTIECVFLKKKTQVQFDIDQQFAKSVDILELKTVNQITQEIANSFMIKREFMDDFSVKDEKTNQWLKPSLTLREQHVILDDKCKLRLAKKYNFTIGLLLEKKMDLKLNTLTLSLTYNESKERVMNGKLSYNIEDRPQRNDLSKLVALSVIAENRDMKSYLDCEDVSKFEPLVPPYIYSEIQSSSKLKTKMKKKFVTRLQRHKHLNTMDAQCEFVNLCSQHPFFRFNLYHVQSSQDTTKKEGNSENDSFSTTNNHWKENILGIDDKSLCLIHPKDKCIIFSTLFSNIVTFSANGELLSIVLKQPEPIFDSTLLIKSPEVVEIETILMGAIDYFTRKTFLSQQADASLQDDLDSELQNGSVSRKNSNFSLPTHIPTTDINLLLSDKNIVSKALTGLEEYNKQIYAKTGPVQLVLKEMEDAQSQCRRRIISNYIQTLENEAQKNNEELSEIFKKPMEYLELVESGKSQRQVMEESYIKLLEIETERKVRELEVKLLENISRGIQQSFSVSRFAHDPTSSSLTELDQLKNQIYPKQVLDIKREMEYAFRELDLLESNNGTEHKQATLLQLKQLFDSQIQHLLHYEQFLNDKYQKLRDIMTEPSGVVPSAAAATSSFRSKTGVNHEAVSRTPLQSSPRVGQQQSASSNNSSQSFRMDTKSGSSGHLNGSSSNLLGKATTASPIVTPSVSVNDLKSRFNSSQSSSSRTSPTTTDSPTNSPTRTSRTSTVLEVIRNFEKK